ncbi:hypothetical protein ACFE04_006567 [Oxalis oulophora]
MNRKTFWQVLKKKSTENYKGAPYITTLLSTSLWTFYGLLKPGGLLVVTVNAAGAALQLIYVTLFIMFAPKDKKIKAVIFVAMLDVCFLGLVIAVTLLAIPGNTRLTFVGILCAVLTIAMYAAPLSAMRTVIRTRSVQYMPFLLSFFLLLNAGTWSIYAVLVKDYYIGVSPFFLILRMHCLSPDISNDIGVPNAIGFVLGTAQLIIYAIYKNKTPVPTKSTIATIEEGVEITDKAKGELVENEINPNLNKGFSLPKSIVARQYSLQQIYKTLSF